MPIKHSLWKISTPPEQLTSSSLSNEQLLETMIVARSEILSDEWMLIGRQEETPFGGRTDLLALAPDSSVVLIELKRNRTPREVVAQALDYASWVETLRAEDIANAYSRFAPNRSLRNDFETRFGIPFDEEALNKHQIVIVAASLDESTERIIRYLGQRDVPINVICFQIFANGSDQFLSRAWLIDPVQTQVNATASLRDSKEPWNGEFYASFGHGESRSWSEAVQYSFISAGGGEWYTNTLKLLSPGDRVWVKAPGYGFVGVARVAGHSQPLSSFRLRSTEEELPALEVLKQGDYHRQFAENADRSEYFVPVKWLQTVPLDKALNEIGLFGNQNTVCKPTTPKWRSTIERLKLYFPNYDD